MIIDNENLINLVVYNNRLPNGFYLFSLTYDPTLKIPEHIKNSLKIWSIFQYDR